ncbi:glutamine--tRNA ligase/YqeY domain fusion protein [Spirochaeta thermophila]|uniref:Glutamine--tRNA ligase n=1 Tax=Winmispira thermophila (strain ATCC 49972 / DSM 6192 / RI 19.B1) TaxID=665571 RepID=E0RT50_WINT6|nr:glutamine--tRNA ligase/YqeY domain fusion protein [Spirochaeta thermophila]ADN02346.1 glutaminyl-tRNA synthetase [Spirochaeta thermophila DSM 6192]
MSREPGRETIPDNFIDDIIRKDLETGWCATVRTRFPPEPNGYLHIGHAKSIVLNFSLAEKYGGTCNLRFDDTNPEKETEEYVRAIMEDVRWLGFDWGDRLYFASDYFDRMYELAVRLIKVGKAYVDHSTPEEISRMRGVPTEPGIPSPYRDRSVEENLELFEKMRRGEFEEGECVLRAKIDMSSPNMHLRDPVMYRIKKVSHYRQGDRWCIYPTYDWAHGLEDAFEGITHSICTLEFEVHRPLYDWFLDQLPDIPHPKQIEFARLNLTHTVMSKRLLTQLVQEGYVDGWDDPRLPTIAGLRRRGFTPSSIRTFCYRIGVSKVESVVDMAFLEAVIREELNKTAPRRMAVLEPVKLVITNYPEDEVEWLEAENNPEDPSAGTRLVPFCRELYIEREDFMEDPPPKYYRLAPGREVRLKHAYIVKCEEVVKDEQGNIVEIRCTYDPETRSGGRRSDRKVKATLHWVSARHGFRAQVRLYDRLFTKEDPTDVEEGKTFLDYINPDSLVILEDAVLEPSLEDAKAGEHYQFLRKGYFCLDSRYSAPGHLVFNRTVTLKDEWERIKRRMEQEKR